MKKILLAASISTLLLGCATQTFHVNGSAGTEPDQDKMQVFFVAGIGQEQEMNAAEVCGGADKVAKVQVKQTFLDGLLVGITYGIFTPRHAKVFCNK